MSSSVIQFLCQKLVSFLHALFNFISTVIFRLRKNGNSLKSNLDYSEVISGETNVKGINFVVETESESEKDIAEFRGFENEVEGEKSEGFLNFKFPTFEEFSRSKKELVPFTSTEFIPGRSSSSSFVDEQANFKAQEITHKDRSRGCSENEEEIIAVDECLLEKTSEKVDNGTDDILVDEKENAVGERIEFSEKEERVVNEENNSADDQEFLDEGQFHSEKNPMVTDSDSESESTSFERIRSVVNSLVDSYSEGFLSDGEFGFDASMDTDGEKENLDSEGEWSDLEENQELSNEFDDEDSDVMEELRKLEEDTLTSDFLSENDFNVDLDKKTKEQSVHKNGANDSENQKSRDSSTSNSEDANKLESLWEHRELIDQLKMELRKVRATGLPTISEESESPEIMDDLKPWKIDERFQLEDCIDELNKFYKCYRERMRKFDILNYQKMHAIGFMQLKDPLQSVSRHKRSAPTLKSIFPCNLSLFKHGSRGTDPMKNLIKELQADLEVIYVGQMCLSWEFLHWQYEKALDLWDSDPRGINRYNEVAGEFQQCQVLMQRFIEDEPFQGPRVENYIKSRCVHRNLLQVPVIKVDSLKDKKKARSKDTDEYIVTSDMLVEIVEESIRIFWRFVRADKGCTSASAKEKPELQNPEDLELLMEVRKTLQKKERKLRDILRSENCILRRIRRYRDDDLDQVLYFFAQVDMKLRLTYRKRHSYATKSNQHRIVKTPGGKLVYQSTKKRASGPKCPVTGKRIQGIPHLRPAEYKRSRLSRNRRTVNRAYGGVLSGGAVRERIIRAFLVEEQKIVKKVLKIQKAKEKQAAKS
ncbi:unnamed protein product [Fraxinus pennsylvanica]|uniref:60S ribosomal protein L34 n=2 Tax=Magnoliopsida TaxID=3398 RepID=A0AAD1YWG3_9LAMI|nr:unnamed protein product [Fraxinus pennsylvanica]